ncbi:MAG: hypothetical protein ACRCZF_15055, partial [Gemmataceae bacterium]
MLRMPFLVAVLAIVLPLHLASAAVIVIGNPSADEVTFQLTRPGQKPEEITLVSGQTRTFFCGKRLDVQYNFTGTPVAFQLDPYTAYVFAGRAERRNLHGIELAGAAVPIDDIPDALPALKPIEIRVKLLVDDAERRSRKF